METREGRRYSSTRVDSHARCGEIIKEDFFFHTRIKMGEKIRLKFNSFFLFEKKYSGHSGIENYCKVCVFNRKFS